MTGDLHRWGRLFAAFAIPLGVAYSLLASLPDPAGVWSGYRVDLLWPALVLGAAAAVFGALGFTRQRRGDG